MIRKLKWAAGILLALGLLVTAVGYGYVASLDLELEPQGNPSARASDAMRSNMSASGSSLRGRKRRTS